MATATITLTSDPNEPESLGVNIEFDPEYKNDEEAQNPLCHQAAFLALESVAEALGLNPTT